MRLALAVQTLVGLALVLAVACGVRALVSPGPGYTYPWPALDALRSGLLLVLLSVCWWLVDAPTEGRTLLLVSRSHGLTFADVLAVPPLVLGLVLVTREVLRRLG